MKKYMIAACLAIVAVGVVKFTMIETAVSIDDFREHVKNEDNAGKLKQYIKDLTDEDLSSLSESPDDLSESIKNLIVYANSVKSFEAPINLFIERLIKIQAVDVLKNIAEKIKDIKTDYTETINKNINSFIQEDESIDKFASGCKSISEEQ